MADDQAEETTEDQVEDADAEQDDAQPTDTAVTEKQRCVLCQQEIGEYEHYITSICSNEECGNQTSHQE